MSFRASQLIYSHILPRRDAVFHGLRILVNDSDSITLSRDSTPPGIVHTPSPVDLLSGNLAIPFYDFYMCKENRETTRLEKARCISEIIRTKSQPPHIIDTDKNYIVVNRDIIYDHLFTGR